MSVEPSLRDPEDRRAGLIAVRTVLAVTIAAADSSNIAALTKQYRETLAELDSLPDKQEVNPLDELDRKRANRLSAKVSDGPAKRPAKRRTGSS